MSSVKLELPTEMKQALIDAMFDQYGIESFDVPQAKLISFECDNRSCELTYREILTGLSEGGVPNVTLAVALDIGPDNVRVDY